MKRDLLLCADIIRLIAESEEIVTPQSLWGSPLLEAYGDEQISYHVHLLYRSGFIDQFHVRLNEDNSAVEYCEYALTNAGQDFYAVAAHPAFREYHDKVTAVLGGSPPYDWIKAHVEAIMLKEILAVVARDDAEASEDSFYALRGIGTIEETPVDYDNLVEGAAYVMTRSMVLDALTDDQWQRLCTSVDAFQELRERLGRGRPKANDEQGNRGIAITEIETHRETIKRFAYALLRRDAITLLMFGVRVSDFMDYRDQPDFYDAVISTLVRDEQGGGEE